ncbi:MAG: energy-coupling factor transporter ATPase [Nitrospirota bacterium]
MPLTRQPVRDLLDVWRDTRLIVLAGQTAAVYAAILIPFKMGIPLIPGFTELRPANAFPVAASLLFGPAAAWGSGLGNLIGDCFGTLGPGSFFGFLGNFCYGYVPYLLWGRLGPFSSGLEPEPRSWHQTLELAIVCTAAALTCALVVAWGVDLLGLFPFHLLAPAIFLNNLVMGLALAPPLLLFLHPRVKRWRLRYEDVRETLDVRRERFNAGREPLRPTPATPPAAFVALQQVRFTYEGSPAPALDGLSLEFHRGESVALLGRSGAGKSTLCHVLAGLVPNLIAGHWSGRASVGGQDTTTLPVWKQAETVGLVFQDFEAQLVSTNVEMELAFPLECLDEQRTLPPAAMRERVARTLDLVGLAGLERRPPSSLSGGQRQRLAIAATLIKEPALIALDEPLTDLDPAGRRTLLSLLDRMKAGGAAVVLAEQDPEAVVRTDRLCVLERGALAWDGPPRRLFSRPDLLARYGLAPLPIARCFEGLGLAELPLSVEEAWELADELGLSVVPAGPAPRPKAGPPVVEVQKTSFAYQPGAQALSDLSLTIGEGEFVAIIGQNGSGKSTLARLLNGLLHPTAGRVLVYGEDTRALGVGRLAATVGYVFQNPDQQIFAETVEAEVAFGAHNLGVPAAERAARVADALKAVGLDGPEILDQDPFSLTKGDRQRVAVASVLAARPRILIFDEPTTGLDAEETGRMMEMIRRLNRAGHTIVMITHALSLVAAYAHRCVVLHRGRTVADGPTGEVFGSLLAEDRAARLGLEVPAPTRFAARWGHQLLTPEEVRAALRRR